MLDYFVKGGPLMYPILLCSLAGLAIFINKCLQYRRIFKELASVNTEDGKTASPFLAPILKAVAGGCDERAIGVIGTRQMRSIEQGLSWLGLISTIAPLLGLTGTVTGMINAFMVIEHSKSVSPSMLAGGVWEALITTAAGLLVAIPIHIGQHYLEKQADDIAFALKEILQKICNFS